MSHTYSSSRIERKCNFFKVEGKNEYLKRKSMRIREEMKQMEERKLCGNERHKMKLRS
jgi:hypothetical protein